MLAYRVLGLLAACLLAQSCGLLPAATPAPTPALRATAEGDGNDLAMSAEGQAAILDVHSQRGIGAAAVELAAGQLPEAIVLRLHLRGLEDFRLTYDQTVITAAVNSANIQSVRQHAALADGGEQPLTPDSPLWLEIRAVSSQAPTRIPLDDGYFEVTLPEHFWSAGSRSFTIHWIDFYR